MWKSSTSIFCAQILPLQFSCHTCYTLSEVTINLHITLHHTISPWRQCFAKIDNWLIVKCMQSTTLWWLRGAKHNAAGWNTTTRARTRQLHKTQALQQSRKHVNQIVTNHKNNLLTSFVNFGKVNEVFEEKKLFDAVWVSSSHFYMLFRWLFHFCQGQIA